MPAIFHLVLESEFRSGCRGGEYRPARLAQDGFVHCAGDEAAAIDVARSYFSSAREPVLVLRIETERLGSPCRFEPPAPPSGERAAHHVPGRLFPHVYGPIELSAIDAIGKLSPGGISWPS